MVIPSRRPFLLLRSSPSKPSTNSHLLSFIVHHSSLPIPYPPRAQFGTIPTIQLVCHSLPPPLVAYPQLVPTYAIISGFSAQICIFSYPPQLSHVLISFQIFHGLVSTTAWVYDQLVWELFHAFPSFSFLRPPEAQLMLSRSSSRLTLSTVSSCGT